MKQDTLTMTKSQARRCRMRHTAVRKAMVDTASVKNLLPLSCHAEINLRDCLLMLMQKVDILQFTVQNLIVPPQYMDHSGCDESANDEDDLKPASFVPARSTACNHELPSQSPCMSLNHESSQSLQGELFNTRSLESQPAVREDIPQPCSSLQSLQSRISCLEEQFDDFSQDTVTSIKHEVEKCTWSVQEHVDLELSRIRMQQADDYSKCSKAVAALEVKLLPYREQTSKPDLVPNGRPAVSSADLSTFNPMQRGLCSQLRNMLTSLVDEKRESQLQELRHNLASQPEGAAKQQQLQVLDLLQNELL